MGVITIDGYASSGKSTLARMLANALGIQFLGTGSIYRAIALYFMEHQTDYKNKDAVKKTLGDIKIEFSYIDGRDTVILNGEDVSKEIRLPQISNFTPNISKIPAVRIFVRKIQHKLADYADFVVEGRDIGTVVFPKSPVKFFITADLEERAIRRFTELRNKGNLRVTRDEILEDISKRDNEDINRKVSPIIISEDMHIIDTTKRTPEEVLPEMIKICKRKFVKIDKNK